MFVWSLQIAENLGIEMIFSLVSSAQVRIAHFSSLNKEFLTKPVIVNQEWLNVRWDEHKKEEENRLLVKKLAEEEAERTKFEGTRVTVESFLAWRNEFELDTGIAAKREKLLGDNKKLTGKELFLRDNTLNESDLKFLLEAGDPIESVKIDESLFQNLDDLDFGSDDDDDDDEDYVPGKD